MLIYDRDVNTCLSLSHLWQKTDCLDAVRQSVRILESLQEILLPKQEENTKSLFPYYDVHNLGKVCLVSSLFVKLTACTQKKLLIVSKQSKRIPLQDAGNWSNVATSSSACTKAANIIVSNLHIYKTENNNNKRLQKHWYFLRDQKHNKSWEKIVIFIESAMTIQITMVHLHTHILEVLKCEQFVRIIALCGVVDQSDGPGLWRPKFESPLNHENWQGELNW